MQESEVIQVNHLNNILLFIGAFVINTTHSNPPPICPLSKNQTDKIGFSLK